MPPSTATSSHFKKKSDAVYDYFKYWITEKGYFTLPSAIHFLGPSGWAVGTPFTLLFCNLKCTSCHEDCLHLTLSCLISTETSSSLLSRNAASSDSIEKRWLSWSGNFFDKKNFRLLHELVLESRPRFRFQGTGFETLTFSGRNGAKKVAVSVPKIFRRK